MVVVWVGWLVGLFPFFRFFWKAQKTQLQQQNTKKQLICYTNWRQPICLLYKILWEFTFIHSHLLTPNDFCHLFSREYTVSVDLTPISPAMRLMVESYKSNNISIYNFFLFFGRGWVNDLTFATIWDIVEKKWKRRENTSPGGGCVDQAFIVFVAEIL